MKNYVWNILAIALRIIVAHSSGSCLSEYTVTSGFGGCSYGTFTPGTVLLSPVKAFL